MKTSFHPYALLFGLGIGIVTLAALRHPLFALFFGIAATVGIDMALKGKLGKKDNTHIDKDDKS